MKIMRGTHVSNRKAVIFKEESMKKRVLSLLLAAALCLTMLPGSVWATVGGETPESGTTESGTSEGNGDVTPGEGGTTEGGTGTTEPSEGGEGGGTVENAVAKVDGQEYAYLFQAINAAADGGTVELLKDVTEGVDFEKSSDTTVTLAMNGHSLSYATGVALLVTSGKLIIRDEANIKGPDLNNAEAVRVSSGALEFQSKATIKGGLLVTHYYDPATETTTNGRIDGGLKEGTIITSNGEYSVSVEGSEKYTQVCELLPEGCAFAKYESGTDGGIVDGSVRKLTEDVIVVAHTHDFGTGGKCACGYTCPHTNVDERGKCAVCGAAIKAQDSDGKYYASMDEAFRGVADGGTVTMLSSASELLKLETGETVTLVMSGHSLSYDGGTDGTGGTGVLTVTNGKLIIADTAAISLTNGSPGVGGANADTAVTVFGNISEGRTATLEFKNKATITGGLWVSDAKLEGGLKEGSIITSNGSYSVYAADCATPQSVAELLAPAVRLRSTTATARTAASWTAA